jgi:hypothetical protein
MAAASERAFGRAARAASADASDALTTRASVGGSLPPATGTVSKTLTLGSIAMSWSSTRYRDALSRQSAANGVIARKASGATSTRDVAGIHRSTGRINTS